ncbi:Uncharacterised protein, partial [Mesomycoplasma hyorhinis]
MWLKLSCKLFASTAATESPPPITVYAFSNLLISFATASVPHLKLLNSATPSVPFHKTVW